MPVRISVDVTKAVEGIHNLQKSQLPFATAKTLSNLAYGAQAKARQDIDNPGTRFQLRNKFTQQSIKVKPADKNTTPIAATIYTDPRAGYLGLQETGGERVPVGGREHLATPTKFLFDLIGGYGRIIPQAYRPKAMLAYADANQKKLYLGRKGLRAAPAVLQGYTFFLVTLNTGTLAIVGRHSSGREIYPFYVLVPERTIQQRFGLVADVGEFVKANYDKVWKDVWRDINVRGIRIKI